MKLKICLCVIALAIGWGFIGAAVPQHDFRYFFTAYQFQAHDGHTGSGDFEFWTRGHMKSRAAIVSDLKAQHPEIQIVTITSIFEFKSNADYVDFLAGSEEPK